MKKKALLVFIVCISSTVGIFAQEDSTATEGQSREPQAMDATATQWSFQSAYQIMPDYHDDLVNGVPRSPGLDNYLQIRIGKG